MRSLLMRILLAGLIAIASFALVSGIVFQVGFRHAIAESNRKNTDSMSILISRELAAILQDHQLIHPALLAYRIDVMARDLPSRMEYLAVKDASEALLYFAKKGQLLPVSEWPDLRNHFETAFWHTAGEAREFSFSFEVVPVDADASGQVILLALKRNALWAGLFALLVSSCIAFLFCRPLSIQTGDLSSALAAMEAGKRDVPIPFAGVKELDEIAQSAEALQKTLTREESLRLQWTADIAHDLRTPLTALKGQFEGMIDGVLPVDTARLERNYRELQKLESLVSELSELSRIETPGYRVRAEPIDLLSIVEAEADRFSDRARERGMSIEVRQDKLPFPVVMADPELVGRALSNLIDNALRYGETLQPIVLSLSNAALDFVQLSVENTGEIPTADRPHLFDRLYRGDRSRSSAGAGLGLSIVQAVVQAHGGRVFIECDEERHLVRFVLLLPVDGLPSGLRGGLQT